MVSKLKPSPPSASALCVPCASLLICFPSVGWVSPWQLGATFSQAAAHWRLKPVICSSGSISKDLLLSSHDFISIIIILVKLGSWAHYKAFSPSLTWNRLCSAFPPQLRDPPSLSFCSLLEGSKRWPAAMDKSAWVSTPPHPALPYASASVRRSRLSRGSLPNRRWLQCDPKSTEPGSRRCRFCNQGYVSLLTWTLVSSYSKWGNQVRFWWLISK